MKSKSGELNTSGIKKESNSNYLDFDVVKPFDFVGLYKTAAETSKILEKHKVDENKFGEKHDTGKVIKPKRARSPYKNKKKKKQEYVDITQIIIDGSTLNTGTVTNSQVNNSTVASRSNEDNRKQNKRVKSIIKNTSLTDQSMDSTRSSSVNVKPKKRNKSVSFMLDDNEELDVKRTKSDDSVKTNKNIDSTKIKSKDKKQDKKRVQDQVSEKENTATNTNNEQDMDLESSVVTQQDTSKLYKRKKTVKNPTASIAAGGEPNQVNLDKKNKSKKVNKLIPDTDSTKTENNNNEVNIETKVSKSKNKKKKNNEKITVGDGKEEPQPKTKKDFKQDIVDDLENLSIGDNANTLTNLLDEMTVVDKDKKKKLKQKFNKNKKPKGSNKEDNIEKPEEEVKEKVKWKKRKWNKDKKGDLDDETMNTTVIVENLPLSILFQYKGLLSERFVKCGLIKKIGVAEMYPLEESKPVFTTTINFYSDGAAELALGENNTIFEGNKIKVKRPLPPSVTTVVVRSYGELTDQNLSSTFLEVGKIRSIRHLVKGKKSMSTAFIEFHGPAAVERALKLSAEVKIAGKKIHVAKFEVRSKKKKDKKNDGDSAADADSEQSND